MKWLYKLLGFREIKIIGADDVGSITLNEHPSFMKGDTIWIKEGEQLWK